MAKDKKPIILDPEAQQTPPVDPETQQTPPVDPEAQQTPPVDPEAQQTPPVDPETQQTPPVDHEAQQTPAAHSLFDIELETILPLNYGTPAIVSSKYRGRIKNHCGSVIMNKQEGYTAGPNLRAGEEYDLVIFFAYNGYISILIPPTEAKDGFHCWVDEDCIELIQ